MVRMFRIGLAALLLTLSTAAVSQELRSAVAIRIAPNTIASIPPLVRAVLSGDREQVIKVLGAGGVDDQVHAKDGSRAGYTPLILAATISNPEIVLLLIKQGAKITVLDDFHRSAFWYAAFEDSFSVSSVLTSALGASDVINIADTDLHRTPLHLAVRGADPNLVSLLLKMGASGSMEQKDILGETPRDYCKLNSTKLACRPLL
jgi:hypothetical protein